MTPEQWIVSGDTGISSETIWSVAMGVTPDWADIPHDPADFGRCYRLLLLFPHWKLFLPAVAAKYPKWSGLVEAWEELTALYEEESPSGRCPKLFKRMQEIRGLI